LLLPHDPCLGHTLYRYRLEIIHLCLFSWDRELVSRLDFHSQPRSLSLHSVRVILMLAIQDHVVMQRILHILLLLAQTTEVLLLEIGIGRRKVMSLDTTAREVFIVLLLPLIVRELESVMEMRSTRGLTFLAMWMSLT
jgi:hypothetical protein